MIEVTAAILANNGRLLIAQRRPTSSLPNKWEFPGGKVEAGETPEECLKREMEEEFGIDVSVREYLGESVFDYQLGTIRLLAFRVTWNGGSFVVKAHKAIEWVLLTDLPKYDFAPADVPFIDKLRRGEIEL
jgi:8-oxo-dGTP diphosphatase